MSSLRELCEALLSLKGKTLVTTHSLADVDAVASAVVVGEILASRVRTEVRLVDEANAGARRILSSLGIRVPLVEDLNYNNLVLVDLASADLLAGWKQAVTDFKGMEIVIDHHFHARVLPAQVAYINRRQSSTCEIVYQTMRLLGIKPSQRQATLLLAGIVADTAQFKSATSFTFEAVAALLKHAKKDYSYIAGLLKAKADLSERIAVLKALHRAKVIRLGDFLIAAAEASSFELRCAASLVDAGCDVAFVANLQEGRISGAKDEVLKGIHVGKIMASAGKAFFGSGGGHKNVGGARGRPEKTMTALEKCIIEAQKQLSKLVKPPAKTKAKQVI